jgi:lipooligosaccharide transport system permease protein
MSVEKRAYSGARAHMGAIRSAKSRVFGSWYVTEHRLLTMRAYLISIIMGSFFNPIMYLFALGVGIGSFIDAKSGPGGILGVSYLTFVGPALLASAAINAAFEETSYPVLGGFKWSREFFAMYATPLKPRQIANGVLYAALIRMVFTVSVFWCFLKAFEASPGSFGIVAILPSILGGLAMGTTMMSVASYIEEDDGWFPLIQRMIIAPMFLFSGTFYPLEGIPLGLRWIGWISPLWHATNLGRFFIFDLPLPLWLVIAHFAYLSFIIILGLGLSYRFFGRRLSK